MSIEASDPTIFSSGCFEIAKSIERYSPSRRIESTLLITIRIIENVGDNLERLANLLNFCLTESGNMPKFLSLFEPLKHTADL